MSRYNLNLSLYCLPYKLIYASDSVATTAAPTAAFGDEVAGVIVAPVVVAVDSGVGLALLPSMLPSSMFGTIKLSRDIKLYFMTKEVNRLHRNDLASKSSNSCL